MLKEFPIGIQITKIIMYLTKNLYNNTNLY